MKQALVMVDIQNDYFPGGKMELVGMDSAAAKAVKVLEHFRSENLPVFHIQHVSNRPGATFFLPETEGVAIHHSVAPKSGESLITKHFPNSFKETELLDRLRQRAIEEITVCGAMSHMCIDSTVRAAFDLGFRCRLVADGCATKDISFAGITIAASQVHGAFMAALSAPFAHIVEAETITSGKTR